MQHIAVDIVGAEMFEGTRHRLRHLLCERCRRIVGKPMILSAAVGELCLQKKILASHQSAAIGLRNRLSHASFEVVPPLIGGIDGAEPRP